LHTKINAQSQMLEKIMTRLKHLETKIT